MDLDYLLGYLIGLGTILLTGKSLIRGLTYAANEDAPNQIPDLGNILEGLRRGSYTGDQASTWMAQMGFNQDVISGLILNYEQLLGAGDAIIALYRGTISQSDFDAQATKLGLSASTIKTMQSNFETRIAAGDLIEAEHRGLSLPPEVGTSEQEVYGQGMTAGRLALYRQLALKVPQVADLLNFSAWNLADPSCVEKYGLGQNMPSDWVANCAVVGIPEPMALKLWQSHWQPVPLFMLKTLYETGQISQTDLQAFLNIYMIPPGFQSSIMAAFNKVPADTQIIEALQNGTIQESQLDAYITRMGYGAADIPLIHALIMNKATLPSAEQKYEIAQQKAAFKSLSVGNVMSSYEEGIIAASDVETYLTDLGIAPDIITFQLNHSDLKIANKALTENITAVGNAFMLGQITQADATAQLSTLGVSPVKQQNLIYKWTKAVPVKTKLPSEATLTTWLKNQIIDIPTYQSRMAQLGYSPGDILLFIATINKSTVAAAELLVAQSQFAAPLP